MVAPAQFHRDDVHPPTNDEVAQSLETVAHRLDERGKNLFRVRAYRIAAGTIRALDRPAVEILKEGGRDALRELPGIGDRLSATLTELLETGRMPPVDDGNASAG